MPWTMQLVKDNLWRETQKTLFKKESTTQLLKLGEIEQIYDVINLALGKRGIHVPWPCKETLNNQQLEYLNNN